jgi:hypothetical protein
LLAKKELEVPSGQSLQLSWPRVSWYLPAGQYAHMPSFDWMNRPVGHLPSTFNISLTIGPERAVRADTTPRPRRPIFISIVSPKWRGVKV